MSYRLKVVLDRRSDKLGLYWTKTSRTFPSISLKDCMDFGRIIVSLEELEGSSRLLAKKVRSSKSSEEVTKLDKTLTFISGSNRRKNVRTFESPAFKFTRFERRIKIITQIDQLFI